jgi:hypothetical protein
MPYVTDDFDEYVASLTRHYRVAATKIGALFVSTIFMGVAANFGDRPLLFETMVFAPPHGSSATDQIIDCITACRRSSRRRLAGMARRGTGRRGAAEIAARSLPFGRTDLLAGQRARRQCQE